MKSILTLFILLLLLRTTTAAEDGLPEKIDFQQHIRPILAENCISCHGADAKKRKGELRLDIREGALAEGEDGTFIIVPGKPDESEFFRRVTTEHPRDLMPPRRTKKELTKRQIELLRRWIEQGAKYGGHGEIIPPAPVRPNSGPPLPKVEPEAQNGLPKKIEFGRHVRPILSENCFTCHGSDAKARRARLRLDVREGALAERGEGIFAIVPGKPDSSELYRRITADDPADRMPRSKTGEKLSDHQIALLRQWIEQGAEYEDHWAFIPPTRPPLPKVNQADWPRNEIDHFILARLEKEGLAPGGEADRRTLIRRVTLDLTGLPPTPAEVDAFVADKSPNAYEELVDRLLGSPRFGEHMARFWLDAARYGDTHGLHLDNYREIWPYRDWVIGAFNSNLPFDRFVTEQLAGDLLPDPTLDQQVATGFNRCHVTTNEGGSIDEEVYVRNVLDRVTTTGTVFLGLTFECARCHDHLYDPLTSKEFYQFFAFFNSLDGPAMDGNKKDPAPVVKVPTPEAQAKLAELGQSIARIEGRISGPVPELDARQAAWEAELVEKLAGQSQAAAAVKFGPWHSLGPFTAGSSKEAFTTAFPPEQQIDLEKTYPVQQGNDGQLKWVRRPKWVDGQVHALSGENAATYLFRTIAAPDARQITLSLGSDDTITVWLNGRQVLAKEVYRGVAPDQEKLTVPLDAGENRLLMKICNGGGAYGFYFRTAAEPIAPPDVVQALEIAPQQRSDAQRTVLRTHYRRRCWPEFKELEAQRVRLRQQEKQLNDSVPTTLVFRERAQPREAFILKRGEYDQHGEKVGRDTPSALPPMSEDLPRNRLGLAKWLLDPGHPLTSRVTVNRFWQQCFGTGIVKTSENFGQQGEFPSHAELLDWLAVQFPADGWDVKKLIRRLVTSATYRQASRVTPELSQRDPENRLLARGPRFRLDAEMLRDQALSVSGLLVQKLGGPGVKPPQPDGLWFAVGYSGSNTVRFVKDAGPEKVYRRSIYTFWKRTSPPPQMNTFDAPSREACAVRRERTNTPLQALLLLNDPQYVEAARRLAELAIKEAAADGEARAAYMFKCATGRAPDPADLADLIGAHREQLAHYEASPEEANKLIAVGESKPEASLDPAELAAWTMVANLILNLDEVITKR